MGGNHVTEFNYSIGRRAFLSGTIAASLSVGLGRIAFAQSDKPWRFLIMSPITGVGATYGGSFSLAAKTSIELINGKGGVLGRKIDPVIVDTGTDPAKAAVLLHDQISSNRPDVVFQGGSTAELLAMAPISTREKILLLCPIDAEPIDDVAKFPYLFSVQNPFSDYARILVKDIKQAGAKSVGMLTALDGTGELNAKLLPPVLKDAGIQLLASERFKPTDLDMTSQLRQIEAAKPDVIYIEATGAPIGYILQGLLKLGITRPIVFGKAAGTTNLESLGDTSKLGPNFIFNHAISHRGPGGRSELEVVKSALPIFKEKSGGKLATALFIYSWGYDAPLIWAAAVRDAKSGDLDKVVAQLESWGTTPVKDVQFMYRDNYPYSPKSHLPAANDSTFSFSSTGTLDDTATRLGVPLKF